MYATTLLLQSPLIPNVTCLFPYVPLTCHLEQNPLLSASISYYVQESSIGWYNTSGWILHIGTFLPIEVHFCMIHQKAIRTYMHVIFSWGDECTSTTEPFQFVYVIFKALRDPPSP